MKIYWPGGSCHLNRNDCSIVALLDFHDFEALFPGDIGESGQKALSSAGFTTSGVELLKVPHHGADCLWEPFLEAVRPEVSIISVGKNPYGHPTVVTLDKLRKIGSRVFRTDEQGTVEVTSDGEGWWVR